MSNSIDPLAAGRRQAAESAAVDGAGGVRPVAGGNGSSGSDESIAVAGKDAVADSGKLAGTIRRGQLQGRIDEINRQLQLKAVSVQFQIEPGYKDVILKVVDQQDGKVVLQIPSEEVVRIARVMGQLKGVLLEKTA